jgi:hypothetical protein
MRIPKRESHPRHPTHRLTDERCAIDAFVIHHAQEIFDEEFRIELLKIRGRTAKTAVVDGDAGEVACEHRYLLPPRCGVGAGTVAEDNRRAVAVSLVVDVNAL